MLFEIKVALLYALKKLLHQVIPNVLKIIIDNKK